MAYLSDRMAAQLRVQADDALTVVTWRDSTNSDVFVRDTCYPMVNGHVHVSSTDHAKMIQTAFQVAGYVCMYVYE